MLRKLVIASLPAAILALAGCHAKVQNPIANINSKQPDKVLFDRALDSMAKARYIEARSLLDTLLTTYPDSEYVARAKLSKGDAWYSEGGTAGLQEAEVEYKDFITFFPNLPEAAEAQLKVANIHYKQMEKSDRDFAQAMRAADEYKTLIQQFADSTLVPEAKQRLREVQEVLADRQFRIARFYYLRNNFAASEARLTSLLDTYPLYSSADEALFMMGSLYEKEALGIRLQKNLAEAAKERLSAELDKKAIDAYSRLVTRYPVMARADDARRRLEAMNAPVPTPTPEAIAQNKAEEDSRDDVTRFQQLVGNFRKHPDVSRTSDIGEPTMQEEEIASAPAVIRQLDAELKSTAVTVGSGAAPGANQAPPSSSTQPASGAAEGVQPAASPSQPASAGKGVQASAANQPAPANDPNDLPILASTTPSGSAAASSTANLGAPKSGTPAPAAKGAPTNETPVGNSAANPASSPSAVAPPPSRINEIAVASDPASQGSTVQNGEQQGGKDKQDSSSKKKKKKHKLIPF